jgi:hypothetical protein
VNVYPFIEAEKAGRRNVKRAREPLKVSRATFYAHLAGRSRRGQDDAQLTREIQAVHQESRGRYGTPRVHAELRRRGRRHSRKRVARLIRQTGLAGRPRSGGRRPRSPTRPVPHGRTGSAGTSPQTRAG